MQEFIEFAHTLADTSGPILRHYFRKPIAVEHKADSSPVTLADREAEAALRSLIEQRYPQHGFLGEESGSFNPDAEYRWVIDPIDGTKNFMIGKPIFGTLIALIHKGSPVLGIIDCPLTDERWSGYHHTAFINNTSVSVDKNNKQLNECTLSTTSPYLFSTDKKPRFDAIRASVRHTVYGNDCYAYGLLASGHLDLVVESGLKRHDVMALIPVIKGAGGIITDWEGSDITCGTEETDVIASAHPVAHTEALRLLSQR